MSSLANAAWADEVTFEVEVPFCTPAGGAFGGHVYLRSDRLVNDEYLHDELERVTPTLYRGTFEVATPRASFDYKYSHSLCDATSCPGIEKALDYDGGGAGELPDRVLAPGVTSVHDYVAIWRSARARVSSSGAITATRPTSEMVAFCGPYLSVSGEETVTISYDSYDAEVVTLEIGTTTAYGTRYERSGANRNHFVLHDLSPGVVYHYRIDEGGRQGVDHSFRAPVAADAPFRFAFLGDTQFYGEDQRRDTRAVVEQLVAFDPELVVSAGDLVASEPGANGPGGWNTPEAGRFNVLFGMIEPLTSRAPFMVAMGNHEEDAPYYWDVFDFPKSDAPSIDHYAFRYGSVHFTVLYTGSTDGYDYSGILDSQGAWLERTLEAASLDPAVRYSVIVFHRGPFSLGAHHPTDGQAFWDDATLTRASWRTLAERHGVDLVLAGHNHNFTLSSVNGIRYLTSCSGAPLHELRTEHPEWLLHAERTCSANMFSVGRALQLESRRVDGSVIEESRFALCREAADCDEVESACPEATAWTCDRVCSATCVPFTEDAGVDADVLDAAIEDASMEDAEVDASMEDASMEDAARDAGGDGGVVRPPGDGGCSCEVRGARGERGALIVALLFAGLLGARARRRRSP